MSSVLKATKHQLTRCLQAASLAIGTSVIMVTGTQAETGWPEKEDLTIGFIKLTDMAPLAIAYEKGYFEDEGLYVTLEAQANWRVLLDGVIDGRLDAAHMLAGQPLAATIGYGTQADIVTPLSLDLNGNAITVSNDIWDAMLEHIPTEDGEIVRPVSASSLKPVVEEYKASGTPLIWAWCSRYQRITTNFATGWLLAASTLATMHRTWVIYPVCDRLMRYFL